MKKESAHENSKDSPRTGIWAAAAGFSVVTLLAAFLLLVPGGDATSRGAGASAVASVDIGDHEHRNEVSIDDHMHAGNSKTRYACPMMCIDPVEHDGNCPICGMHLVPVVSPETMEDAVQPRLRLTPRAVHLARIQTVAVMRRAVANRIRMFGKIDFDSAHTTEITAFMPGVIDRVYIKRAGQFVRWGDPLFDIYSSDLLETQRQLVDAMQFVPGFLAFQAGSPHVARDVPVQNRQSRATGTPRSREQEEALKKIAALRHKLSILGLPKRDIDQLMKKGEATGIATVYAPMYGQITVQNATEGAFVNTGTSLFTIADPKYVWARLDVYESDYPWLRRGQRVTFTCEAYPGEVFKAKVVYIDPVFDPVTRTFGVGAITTDDQGGRLKAGMLVRAEAHAKLDINGRVISGTGDSHIAPLVIPASAPLITGERAVVYVSLPGEQPEFEGREVALGPRAGEYYVVRQGLAEGEQVVVNGNFKIDSAMQILARPSLMSPSATTGPVGHDHRGSPAASGKTTGHSGRHDALAGNDSSAAPRSGLADAHQHPNLSDQMNADYMNERRRSRIVDEEIDMHAHGFDEAINSVDPREAPKTRKRPTWSERGRTPMSSISRRKPGQYGDITRQGTSSLKMHHDMDRGK